MILLVIAPLFLCQVLGNPIVGGHVNNKFTFPWIASIQNGGYHKCGGSIISSTIILTAAHCAEEPPNTYIIRVGTTRTDSGGSCHDVTVIKRHERSRVIGSKTLEVISDVALMKVSPPIILDQNVIPVRLANTGYVVSVGTKVTVVGWGSMSDGGLTTYELRSTSLDVIDSGECAKRYEDVSGTWIQSAHLFCSFGNHTDTCQGDSGGPLIIGEMQHMTQIGIISGGIGCGDHRYPGINQDVAYYHDWINENSEKLSINP